MKKILLLLIPILILGACRKDIDTFDIIEEPPGEPVLLIEATVEGTILDENGSALSGIDVRLNEYSATTRFDGRFTFSNVQINDDKQTISVDEEGYFRGSRSFIPLAGNHTELVIQMVRKESIGSFQGHEGLTTDGQEGYAITFPENSIEDSSGNLFEGTVNVFAQWLNPVAAATVDQMPGDLTGINMQGEEQALKTYGIIKLELESDSGESLDLAEGAVAQLKFPVPEELQNNAPGIIPLWSFDDETNRWKEESFAELVGNEYISEVSRLTSLGCHDPRVVVYVSAIIDIADYLESKIDIKVTSQDTDFEFFAYSSSKGSFVVPAPAGEVLELEMIDECSDLILSRTIGGFTQNTSLETINSESLDASSLYTVSGRVRDCDGNPLSGVLIHLRTMNATEVAGVGISNVDGTFSIEHFRCQNSADYQIDAFNPFDKTRGISSEFEFNGNEHLLPDLEVCDPFSGTFTEVLFDGQMFLPNSTPLHEYDVMELSVMGDSIEYSIDVSIIDLPNLATYPLQFLYKNYESTHPQTLDFEPFGFKVSGEAMIEYNEVDENNLFIQFIGTDIEVTNPATYDGTREVKFRIYNTI